MQNEEAVRLLIANHSSNRAEEITNLFRNAGRAVRPLGTQSLDEFEDALKDQQWDVIISDDEGSFITHSDLKKLLEHFKADTPVMIYSNNVAAAKAAAIEQGFVDAIDIEDPTWCLHATSREVKHTRHRNDARIIATDMNELKARYDLLLSSSTDAIAYSTDGMHIHANIAYCNILGYDDADDVAVMPVIDLIGDDHQAAFKQFLKQYKKQADTTQSLETEISHADGELIAVTMEFSPAVYEGESCTQIMIIEEGANTGTPKAEDTALFLKQLTQFIAQAKSKGTPGAVICLQPWNFWHTRNNLGLFLSSELLNQLVIFISDAVGKNGALAKIGGDFFFIALTAHNEEEAMAFAENLAVSIENQIFEIGSAATHLEVRAGVAGFSQDSECTPENAIDNAFLGLRGLAESDKDAKANLYIPPEQPKDLFSKDVDLAELLSEGLIEIKYQPIVSLRGDPGEYYEMQVAINSEEGEAISPDQIAQALTKANGSSKFDQWLALEGIKKLAKQKKKGAATRLLIPITGQGLRDKRLPLWINEVITTAKIESERVVLLFEESTVGSAIKLADSFSGAMSKNGLQIALTNVAPTTEAIRSIKHLEPPIVKIDPELAKAAFTNKDKKEALKDLINQLSAINSSPIVPEVTNASTLASLWQLGAAFIQGVYLQAPEADLNYEFTEIV